MYLEEREIAFFGHLSTGIDLQCHQFWPCIVKIHTPKYNGNIEGGLSSKRYNKAARCFNSVFKEETEVF